jgi:pimeloyl-ACP methyl ester carboxylesterase
LLEAPDRSERIPVGGGVELHALRWEGRRSSRGRAAAFVLVHGLASNARLWDGVASRLAAAGHPVLAVDQRGHGLSSKPAAGYDMETVARDLATVVERSGFVRPVLAGQSWGANVAIEVAACLPGSVRAVGCIDGGAIDLSRRFARWDECADALRPPPLEGWARLQVEEMFRREHPDWPESGIAGVMASFHTRPDGTVSPHLDHERHMLVLRGLWAHHPSESFPSIREPVLFVVAGTEPDPQLLEDVSAIEDVSVRMLEGDHDLHAQRPAEVASLLRTLAR